MANLQDIRRRIRSVKSIQQITNAMDMVATSRLRRAKEAANNNRPYAEKTSAVIRSVAAAASGVSHPLLEQHSEGKRLILVMAADKGLAGAYSSNALKTAMTLVEDKANTQIVAVGRKARDFFKNRGFDIVHQRVGIGAKIGKGSLKTGWRGFQAALGLRLLVRYTSSRFKNSAYTSFISAKLAMSERKTVVLTTLFRSAPAACSTFRALVSDWRVCSFTPPGTNSPVVTSTGSCPEAKTKPLASMA